MPAREHFKISVVVSTYNRPEALGCVLSSLLHQDDPGYEVIVADDGSGPETAALVKSFVHQSSVPISHVWHEDLGFRLAGIRNLAVTRAAGDYVIFLDGDCIVRRNFISEHRRIARTGQMVTGSRILLSKSLTERILSDGLAAHRWSLLRWLVLRIEGEVNRWVTLVPFPGVWWRPYRSFKARRIRGCNLAAWRKDIETVNGFDEAFVGWGHEDLDFVARLWNAGIRRSSGACAATVLHLWHPEARRDSAEGNLSLALERQASGAVRASRGLSDVVHSAG